MNWDSKMQGHRMELPKPRLLRPEEISVRVARCNKGGVNLLLYKDSRCDMEVLDETFGVGGWTRSHEFLDGVPYCTVSVFDGVEWISKSDCGAKTDIESEKGGASDSFKRACVNWGIGRELYTSPEVFIFNEKCDVQERNGKFACYDRFQVDKIAYHERSIVALKIRNLARDEVCFNWVAKNWEEIQEAAEVYSHG